MTSARMEPKFSASSDESRLSAQTEALVGNGWALDKDSTGFEKTFYFKNYTKCLVRIPLAKQDFRKHQLTIPQDFVHVIGTRSKSKNHHSKMTIVGSPLQAPQLDLLTPPP